MNENFEVTGCAMDNDAITIIKNYSKFDNPYGKKDMDRYVVTLSVDAVSKEAVDDWLIRQLMGEKDNVDVYSWEIEKED